MLKTSWVRGKRRIDNNNKKRDELKGKGVEERKEEGKEEGGCHRQSVPANSSSLDMELLLCMAWYKLHGHLRQERVESGCQPALVGRKTDRPGLFFFFCFLSSLFYFSFFLSLPSTFDH